MFSLLVWNAQIYESVTCVCCWLISLCIVFVACSHYFITSAKWGLYPLLYYLCQVGYVFLFNALNCSLGDGKGIRPVNSWVLAVWWWRFDWSFARLIASVVTATSVILSFNKNWQTQVHLEKWPLKRKEEKQGMFYLAFVPLSVCNFT